jgi:hypothetical protein
MDFGRAFTFFFEDEDWGRKLLMGALFGLIGLVTLGFGYAVLYGWAIEISRRNLHEDNAELPAFDDIGGYFIDGIKLYLAQLVWALPMVVIWIPFFIVPFLIEAGIVNEETFVGLSMLFFICIMPFALIFGLALSLGLPVQFGIFAATGSFKAVVNPKTIFNFVRANPGDYVLAWLILYAVQMLMSVVMMMTCFIGMFPGVAYMYAVLGKLSGDAYRLTLAKAPELDPALN